MESPRKKVDEIIFIQMLKVLFNNDDMDQLRLNKDLNIVFLYSIRISDDTMQSVAEHVLDYNHYLSLIVEQYQRLD